MKTVLLHLLLLLMYPNKREIYIFYNETGVAIKDRQLAELKKDDDGLQERDVIIHTYETASAKAEVKKYRIDASKAFTIILVGKDGGEKLRSDGVITTTKLFSTIDAMPMRKTEIKNE